MRFSRAETPEWADRNPVPRGISYNADDVSPHDWTTRASYTVPTAKKARLMAACMYITHFQGATSTDYAEAQLNDATKIWLQNMFTFITGMEMGIPVALSEAGVLLAGETLMLRTHETGTWGAFHFRLSCALMEYDA